MKRGRGSWWGEDEGPARFPDECDHQAQGDGSGDGKANLRGVLDLVQKVAAVEVACHLLSHYVSVLSSNGG